MNRGIAGADRPLAGLVSPERGQSPGSLHPAALAGLLAMEGLPPEPGREPCEPLSSAGGNPVKAGVAEMRAMYDAALHGRL